MKPDHQLALLDLTRLRWRMGDVSFDTDLKQASAAATPSSAVAPALAGHLLLKAERYEEAVAACREALRREPVNASCLSALGQCLMQQGKYEEGLAAHTSAVELAPCDVQTHLGLALGLLIARRPQDAAGAAEQARLVSPADQHAWALLGLAWRMLNDQRETWLNDYAWVHSEDLMPPEGFVDMHSFNLALSAELSRLHRDRAPPLGQTLRGGTQTLGDIFEQRHPLVDALKIRIAQAVASYVACLPEDSSHPFLSRGSAGHKFAGSWSSSLAPGGFHTNHVHPLGWISAAYYVTVPHACEDPAAREGWLQFGQPDVEIGLSSPVRCVVQPRSGRLVLFPSYFWHGTTPFTGATDRLTIAFDVVPGK